MDVGMMMIFAGYGWEDCPDDRVRDEELNLERGLKLFAKEVLPVLKSWQATSTAQAAE